MRLNLPQNSRQKPSESNPGHLQVVPVTLMSSQMRTRGPLGCGLLQRGPRIGPPRTTVSYELTERGGAFVSGQRLPCEREDAHLNGLRRSLERRTLGLNFPKAAAERFEASKTA